ncbi:hypothetical protein ACFVYP_40625 [Kitasatospora sp. NPDC058201]|uniref:hypothetical protein n=1 Tax=Kitasatospora sp. NPDC058201 TaxID=3346379 RepID=UPI0036DD97DA
MFLIEGWPGRTLFPVRRPDRSLAGRVETGHNGWTAFADGRTIIDPDSGLLWLARVPHALLTVALGRRLT